MPWRRREVLRLLVGGAIGAAAAACIQRLPSLTASPPSTRIPIRLPEPERWDIASPVPVTPTREFYEVKYSTIPRVEIETWILEIGGEVERPLRLTYPDLLAMPAVIEMRTLECISNPVGGDLIGNAVWKGVRMADLLRLAGARSTAREVVLYAADGYHTSIPVSLAEDPHSILAYMMNGEVLPLEHGFPLRALWPGRYGMKQPKWITRIELIRGEHVGYWEGQGWSKEAIIKPNSRIDAPRSGVIPAQPMEIQGIAFSGPAGIARVEVSVDDGRSWEEAELIRGPTPYVWTVWRYRWERPEEGEHVLRARVVQNDGYVQPRGRGRLLSGTFPDGTDEQHAVRVVVGR
ncbi:molybdopterin-dependent oxidoreductase [Thermoflexus sp.]|uniref:molybdopterin-dependent oxidoreductase n=1 Tax=Thermoflexus sp. TaxID=1969742 RepID=UPI0025EF500C|nr:molybdopterin-dependent oxidoreductase [Thermoflexus sp.]MCS6962896.1 molybdopterin-dependent oxidoreductase [Thermoflexus sp.]MCX7690127.1 molybdopterin-dependent oxidoreductase [Thermoflexus sp.]MDW8183927.1 molybdopterin-dependent oxidoreductase [Anaerolineae bacterium]